MFFAALASDIDQWSGIPQKRELGEQETTGFQREVNKKRLGDLNSFYSNDSNTVQNALLAATRKTEKTTVKFVADKNNNSDGFSEAGRIEIAFEDLSGVSLQKLLETLRKTLIDRVPSLKSVQPPSALVQKLKTDLSLPSSVAVPSSNDDLLDTDTEGSVESTSTSEDDDAEEALYAEDSHVLDFYHEVAARCAVLAEIPEFKEDAFAGFSKDAVISFLKPIILVDGQHRLQGALLHARESLSKEPIKTKVEELIANGKTSKEVEDELWPNVCRRLPVSLLMCDDPAEHVFQFVIVNQKATPIGRALLGTIVATTLSDDELSRVSERLKASGIQLDEARHVAFLSRSPDSPFYGVVERGLTSDGNDLLPFSVMVSLVKVFRNLKDGRLWSDKNDYADLWRRRYLEESKIVSSWEAGGKYPSAYEYWRSDEGPWRKVFVAFWKAVITILASENPDDQNCWGNTRYSNLFNKIYLHILMVDFFQFLTEVRKGVDSESDISDLVKDWLRDVQSNYFKRDWKLEGQKKDVPGIRKQWSALWVAYRKDPKRAPSVAQFRVSLP